MSARAGKRMLWIAIWAAVAAAGLLGLVVNVQGVRFERRVARDVRALAALPPGAAAPPASLASLPPPVQRYLEVSGAARRAPVRGARLRHGGTFTLEPGGKALAIEGRQYFSVDPPGFVWWGRIRLAPGLWVDGRDQLVGGEGSLLIRAASTFTIADARGRDVDEAELHRLLAEGLWMPTLLRDPRHVTWAPVDASTARATLRVGGREASAEFHFGADGLPTRVTARRWMGTKGETALTPWWGACEDFREVDGLRVPFRITAGWDLPGGPFPYARWELETLELDRMEVW